jgi:hypothetical protein
VDTIQKLIRPNLRSGIRFYQRVRIFTFFLSGQIIDKFRSSKDGDQDEEEEEEEEMEEEEEEEKEKEVESPTTKTLLRETIKR